MTADKSTLDEVENRLSDLPDDKFLKVIELLQVVQSRPEVLRTMSQARPRLGRLRPPRPPTVQRVFYAPVEDLLSDDAEAVAEGLVPRDIMRRCWTVLKAAVPAPLMQSWEDRLGAVRKDRTKVRAIAVEVWAAAGAGLTTAVATVADDADATVRLFGPKAPMELVGRIGSAYRVADEIETLKSKFPDFPVPEIEEEDVALIREALGRIRGEGKGDPSLVIWTLAGRMANPLSFMRHFIGDGIGSEAQMVEASLTHLEGAVRRAGVRSGGQATVGDIAADAEQLASELAAAREMAGPKGATDPRLLAIGGKLKEMVQQKVLANAEADVLSIVPKLGEGADATEAVKVLPKRDDLIRAEERVRAIRKAARFGSTVGLGDEPAKKLKELKKEIAGYLDAMLEHLKQNPDETGARPAAEQHVFNSARMIELADGPSAGYEILKRGQEKLEKAMPKGAPPPKK